MNASCVEVISLKPAVRAEGSTVLDVLVRISPPIPETKVARPTLNLGLVLDRSGSMGAFNKISFAREAAIFAVHQLLPSDRVSVTIFDNEVTTLVPNGFAEDKSRIVDFIRTIEPRNSTALHAGWKEGGEQVRQNLTVNGLNRVILLSDGLANVGETNVDIIATDVHRLVQEGVSTTTMGVGDDYNEALLEAMAKSGDGNYCYIKDPRQLAEIFQTELQGLMGLVGQTVSLGIEPSDGVTVLDVLNDFDRLPSGRHKLPNLVAGMPVFVLVRLEVPAGLETRELCQFRLAWNRPDSEERQVVRISLTLPAVDNATWDNLAANVDVQERTALFLIARLKGKANRCVREHNLDEAMRWLNEAKAILAAAPKTPEMEREAIALTFLENLFAQGAYETFSKSCTSAMHRRRYSKPYTASETLRPDEK